MQKTEELSGIEWLESSEKRRRDLLVAYSIGLIATPAALAGAGLFALENKKNPFFSQQRVGKDGELFTMYKLSSMANHSAEGEPSNGHSDERATRIGKFLRKTTLDEAPQFVNVAKGDMSLVSVRPLVKPEIGVMEDVLDKDEFKEWYYGAYTRVPRHGMFSSFGNVSRYLEPQSEEYYKTRAEYDSWYVENASQQTDWDIVKEAFGVASGKDPRPTE